MITITLLILFDRKKYEDEVRVALERLKKGDTALVQSLAAKLDKQTVVDFWDFSDIPEDDNELNDFFEDFVLALEEEILQKHKLPQEIDEITLRQMIKEMVKGEHEHHETLPEEIVQRITLSSDKLFSEYITKNEVEEVTGSTDIDELEDEDVDEVEILQCEMDDMLKQVQADNKADEDTIMYFKARLIEGLCIPVKREHYRYDLTGNLLNIFLFIMSPQARKLLRSKKEAEKLAPFLEDTGEEFAEDIFDRYLNQDKIIELMALIDSLTLSYNIDTEFFTIDKILRENVKGEWWKRMSDTEKRLRIKTWWMEMENMRVFLQDALDHGYDILISTI